MQEKVQTRISELRNEFQKGEERAAKLEQELTAVRQSMLRISGAIQVLEELVQHDVSVGDNNQGDVVEED